MEEKNAEGGSLKILLIILHKTKIELKELVFGIFKFLYSFSSIDLFFATRWKVYKNWIKKFN